MTLNMDFLLTKAVMTLVTKGCMTLNMDFLLTKAAMTLVTKNVMLTKEFVLYLGRMSRPLPPVTKGFMQPVVTPNSPATLTVHERMASSSRSSMSSLVWCNPRLYFELGLANV